jgi:hypothetical protein
MLQQHSSIIPLSVHISWCRGQHFTRNVSPLYVFILKHEHAYVCLPTDFFLLLLTKAACLLTCHFASWKWTSSKRSKPPLLGPDTIIHLIMQVNLCFLVRPLYSLGVMFGGDILLVQFLNAQLLSEHVGRMRKFWWLFIFFTLLLRSQEERAAVTRSTYINKVSDSNPQVQHACPFRLQWVRTWDTHRRRFHKLTRDLVFTSRLVTIWLLGILATHAPKQGRSFFSLSLSSLAIIEHHRYFWRVWIRRLVGDSRGDTTRLSSTERRCGILLRRRRRGDTSPWERREIGHSRALSV